MKDKNSAKLIYIIFQATSQRYIYHQIQRTMNIIYMLLGVSVVVALVFFVAFIISVKKGQFDDVYTPSVRMLFEDELVKPKPDKDQSDSEAKPN